MNEDNTSGGIIGAVVGGIKSVLFGFVLIIAAFPLILWNEGRARQTTLSLDEGLSAVIQIDPASPNAEQEGKLVYFAGQATTPETLTDATFGIAQQAIRLRRTVEMYQWIEERRSEKKTTGSGTRNVYVYTMEWHEGLVPSEHFDKSAGHENPRNAPFVSQELKSTVVNVGAVQLAPILIDQMSDWRPIHLDVAADQALPPLALGVPTRSEDWWYFSANHADPHVGDVRVGFGAVAPAAVSVVARQIGKATDGYPTNAGDVLAMLEYGQKTPAEMFALAEASNGMITWALRALAFGMFFVGFSSMLSPVRSVVSVVPFFGHWIRLFLNVIAASVAFVIWGATVAVTWILVRPLLAIALLIGAGGALVVTLGLIAAAVMGYRKT